MPQRSRSREGADDEKAEGCEGDREAGPEVVRRVACEVHRDRGGGDVYL